jgi:prepilin-type N-terminal cleavage/methylation domain-containing protein
MRKGLTVIEILVALVLAGAVLALAYLKYHSWEKRVSVENDTRRIYSLVELQRTKSFTEKIPAKIVVSGTQVTVEEQTSSGTYAVVKVIHLKSPFSGTIEIDEKGLPNNTSIIYLGDLSIDAKYSCIKSDGVRVRMGKTVLSSGKRVCE